MEEKPVPKHPPIWTTRVPLRTLLRIRIGLLHIQRAMGRLRGRRYETRLDKRFRALANTWNNLDVLSFYGRPDYRFETSRLVDIHSAIETMDQQRFRVSPEHISWEAYLGQHIGGLKNYLVRPAAERHAKKTGNPPKNWRSHLHSALGAWTVPPHRMLPSADR
jgi:hypothetical protein